MATLYDNSGDSNDGNPNKNPGDENKKPQEVVAKTRRILDLVPQEILLSILARVRRLKYPMLSLACPWFRRIISSPQLYDERLRIKKTEPVLYALIGFPDCTLPGWYILNITNRSFRLRRVDKLAHMPYGSAVVTIGFNMYVFGGCIGKVSQSSVFVIDCRFHKISSLPSLRRARSYPAAGVVGGKIYVIGGCDPRASDWLEVLDVKTETWSHFPGPYFSTHWSDVVTCTVMEDKIYALDHNSCFTYEPKDDRWETVLGAVEESVFSPLRGLWQGSSCVVDDVLFTIDPGSSRGQPSDTRGCSVVSFDPKEKYWRPMTIFCRFPMPEDILYYDSKMANVGGNLVILGRKNKYTEIWCVEITLERRPGGEFRGRIVTVECVLTSSAAPYIEHCRAPTV